MPNLDFQTRVFDKELIDLADRKEGIVRGGRHLLPLLPAALDGVGRIGVIGWGPQGSAQAQNLRDSLGQAVQVTVGLRAGSPSFEQARAADFSEDDGTLGEMFDVISKSDLVILLISDAAQAELFPRIFQAMRPGATLGLSHGFLLAHLRNVGDDFPSNVNVVAVCPKGLGKSVRALYQQGASVNGAGINSSFAVHQDVTGRATDYALAWSVALGSPYTFQTTLEHEYRSDIFGERGILLGAVHGIVEGLYRLYRSQGWSPDDAFLHTAESITGPISSLISKRGIRGVYEALPAAQKPAFERAYNLAYSPALDLLAEIYDEVSGGNEIRSVVAAAQRFGRFPMRSCERTEMWSVGKEVRARRKEEEIPLDAFTAGVYCGVMMAQIDTLLERDHPYSEIANESVIEAADSLNPYMHARGISYMIDNCSTTARLGARKWAPRFDWALMQHAFPLASNGSSVDSAPFASFAEHKIHAILATCAELRPSVDIFVE
jgi:ketol-acid reductoisomerase